MRRFLKQILTIIGVIILIVYALEYYFTYTYYTAKYPRLKTALVKQIKVSDSLDYALIGSSRCIGHVYTDVIEKETGLKGINLGYSSCKPFGVKLMVKELAKNTKIKRIFIQVDYSFNEETPNDIAKINWYPFIKEKHIYEELHKYNKNTYYLKTIPLYRFLKYESMLGLRFTLLSIFKKANNNHQNRNRKAIYFDMLKVQLEDIPNSHMDEIINICKSENIRLSFFTTPIYSDINNGAILKKHLPNYYDFSKTISNKNLFLDELHLNHEGATLFTKTFIDTFFNKKRKKKV